MTESFFIVLSLILEGFFSGSETALVSCNKIKARSRAENGEFKAKAVWRILGNPHRMLATTLLGTNLCVVVASVLATHLFVRIYGAQSARGPLVSTMVMVPLVLIFGEMIPKAFCRRYADSVIYILAPVLGMFQKILFPLVFLAEKLTGWFMRFFGLGKTKKDPFLSREDIELLVRQIADEGVLEVSEQEAIYQIFDFSYTRVGDIMVRLPNTVSVDIKDSRLKVLEKAKQHRFTRYPVLENRRVVGLLNIFDIFYNDDAPDWRGFIRPVNLVYANQKVKEVLYKMQRHKHLMSAVIRKDKIIGVLTLEDIIDEIELI